MEEENFPRGGSVASKKKQIKRPASNVISRNAADSKRTKKSFSAEDRPLPNLLSGTAAQMITYRQLQEQMLMLGCIRKISPFTLDIELPGKMAGTVTITSISEHYTQLLHKELKSHQVDQEQDIARLNNMFRVGQFLPTKILEIKTTNEKIKVDLSLDPRDINSDWNHLVFHKGLLVWAAVASKLDHGYLLDAGVSNSRIFLPFTNVPEGTVLVDGQPLWCVVKKCEVSSTTCTATMSILEKHVSEASQGNISSLHLLVPGMPFNLTISKHVKFGLEGRFIHQHVGYVNEAYLATPLEKASKYKEEETVNAWLLYIQPIIKVAYFTLQDIKAMSDPEHQNGKILRGQVIGKSGGGINFKFPNGKKGFVSVKRLTNMFPNMANLKDSIAKKFPTGSSHQCRILDYNRMEQVYVCSCESVILKEKYFTADDVKIGELVEVKVESITPAGLQVSLGNVCGFIQNMHLANSAYSENIKRKFSKGQMLKARVWSKDEKGVYFTHKQALIESDVCLSSLQEAVVNKEYPGVVVNLTTKGVLVVFYNGLRGILHKSILEKMFDGSSDEMFYVGQVIKPIIARISKDSISLTLDGARNSKDETDFQVSDNLVTATVTSVNPWGMEVVVGSNNTPAIIPTAHLSSSLLLTPLLLSTYNVGDTIRDLRCVSQANQKSKAVLSLREAATYKQQKLKALWKIQVGSIIRCSYRKHVESGICVSVPLVPKNISLKIPYKELTTDEKLAKTISFIPHQAVVIKVLEIEQGKGKRKDTRVTAKLGAVFNHDFKYPTQLLRQYLEDVEQIKKHLLQKGASIAKLELGQRVSCKISKVGSMECLVTVADDLSGIVSKRQCPKNVKVGQELIGVVLWVNYVDKLVELSCKEEVIKKVNETQNGQIGKQFGETCYVDVLVNRAEYVVGVVRNQDVNGQLIFLSPRLHENSFTECIKYEVEKKIKVFFCGDAGKRLIGMHKGYIHELNKRKRKMSQSNSTCKRLHLDENNVKSELSEVGENIQNEGKRAMQRSVETSDEAKVKNEPTESNEELDEDVADEYSDNNDENDASVKSEEDSLSDDDNVEEENGSIDCDDQEESECANSDEEDEPEFNCESEASDNDSDETNVSCKQNSASVAPILPGIQNFFRETKVQFKEPPSSDENDEVDTGIQPKEKKKEKKLTPAEHREIAKREEEELRRQELENADLTREPQTVDQFQKLIKGKPNCSKSWIKYIAHLIQSAEIEKAKNVVREALETINLDMTNERYNMWIAWLNLENDYGNKNSFDEVFEEAIRCNDDLEIYLSVISILAESKKLSEMEEKVQKAKQKFKHNLKMWLEVGRIYYKHGQVEQGRKLMNTALLKLSSKADCVNLTVQFAIMEFQYGDKYEGERLFQTILQHNPKRVDILCSYVDQLVKKGDMESARGVLERAVSQSIPPKKMKTLFKKFKDFETEHGTKEQVEHVTNLAKKYAGIT